MVAIGRTSHAFFFDGVSDSIIIPQSRFASTGVHRGSVKTPITALGEQELNATIASTEFSDFSIEAWVIPDCGGIVVEREGQFRITFGTVDTAGPAIFELMMQTPTGDKSLFIKSATESTTRYDGIVFPTQEFGGIHDSYNRFNTGTYGEATSLNFNHRPLYHIVCSYKYSVMEMYVNGERIAFQKFPESYRPKPVDGHIYVGGKGGQFRGAIEALHFSDSATDNIVAPEMPTMTDATTGMYRFEEPLDIVETVYTMNAVTAATNGSTTTFTIATADAQSLIAKLTGKPYDSSSAITDFTVSPYSMGKYKVNDLYTAPASPTTLSIAHTPYNLLINAGSINQNTFKPNQKPPERVRLHSIDGSNGTVTISSIHVDFVNGTNGLRGLLHSRTADVDNYFVVVNADLLIDNGTGRPYQPPHYGSQIFDRTGQMVLDESEHENHGLVYSSRMAISTVDTNNPFAVTWPSHLDDLFQVGHSGRHALSHITGHEYMRKLPKPSDMNIDQLMDGSADIVSLSFDSGQINLRDAITMNSKIDAYASNFNANILNFTNSSPVQSIVNNGLPASKKELIAIGGATFDAQPFFLKGPVPLLYDDSETRLFHLRPEQTSRIAILKVPALQSSHDLAPFVEIHYNAIDITGASMGVSGPMLMVEKTVPAGSFDLGSGTRVIDVITSDLANTVLYSPGGVIDITTTDVTSSTALLKPHSLLGDNTGGEETDSELDFSTCPVNYTPVNDVNATPASSPKVVKKSHNNAIHESVYHKILLSPTTGIDTNTVTNDILQPITDKTGTGEFDISPMVLKSQTFEMFDIIDNTLSLDETKGKLFVHPTNRSRTNQLSKLNTMVNTQQSQFTLLELMTRGRVRSIAEKVDADNNMRTTEVTIHGIAESALSQNVNVIGSGSPDSHVVKEIEPNAPVVTVTLGGPGQGAVNTKPTFDPSPLMRLPGSTRRMCAVQSLEVFATNSGTSGVTDTLTIRPLNNQSPDLLSWGTYCFPKIGRIYLAGGASAQYYGKTGSGFAFENSATAISERRFLLADGTAVESFYVWCKANGVLRGTASAGATITESIAEYIYNDDNFNDDSLTQDGSTVNDRLFQSMDGVTHDYQLGSQYSSTRAMVEIPFFPQQFFDNENENVFPGPDNSMKIHIDATYTAHTWNPTPVGRRADDIQIADRTASSAYSYNINKQDYISSTTITKVVYDSGNKYYKIYVSHPSLFPPVDTSVLEYTNMKKLPRFRRAFLGNGLWCMYRNDPSAQGYLRVDENDTGTSGVISGSYAKGFFEAAVPQTALFIAQGYRSENLVPIASDKETSSSDYEARSPYYYDNANVKTQGGNLDYGLRQYVSAIEIKAGPLVNPHAPRVQSGVAKTTIKSFGNIGGLYTFTLEDTSNFPELTEITRSNTNAFDVSEGDLLYTAEIILADGTTHEMVYYGRVSSFTGTVTDQPNVVYCQSANTSLTGLENATLKLKRAGRALHSAASVSTSITGERTALTFLPDSSEQWTIAVAASSGSTTSIQITTSASDRLASSNTIGLNIRKDDELYIDDVSGSDVDYLGKVSSIVSNVVGGTTNTVITLTANNACDVAVGDKIRVSIDSVIAEDHDAILNASWLNPYAAGGMRNGDTVWMNMTMNNPHAVEGMFCKSRGVLNEHLVWKGFNGGRGTLASRPRDSIPLENFLIGDTCLETAQNLAQHINKTIEINYDSMLGSSYTDIPRVAYVDPYLATEGHARVLLYDVAHDREFIAFHDLHMQVQSSAATPNIGFGRDIVHAGGVAKLDRFLVSHNGGAPHYFTTQIDVANGFPSENKYLRSTQQSKFIESAYAHDIANSQANFLIEDPSTRGNNKQLMGKGHGHFVHSGLMYGYNSNIYAVSDNALPRVEPAVASVYWANEKHKNSRRPSKDRFVEALKLHRLSKNPSTFSFRDASTLFDTPDGTRCISAFLSLKGIRSSTLDLATHEEDRLEHLPHWTEMDFVRRMVIDCGEVGVKEGVTDIEAATREIVRLINQGGAKNGRTHARRPSQQYPGESERLDLTRIGVRQDVTSEAKDPSSAHINADFAATGSTYDPAPWWFVDEAFDTHDRGSHMGYVRAHIGRVVEDMNGNEGFSIIIHSTVPGASGRNFCVWLDNSKGQSNYKPQFLIGHGGRFRNFWCQPDETLGENMHPAPMPLNKHGRPFAPVTTLREYVLQEEPDEPFTNNHDVGNRKSNNSSENRNVSARIGGINHNTVSDESFEIQGLSTNLVEGLRAGKQAVGRINFGGLVASGIPGFAPDAGTHGFGRRGNERFDYKYGEAIKFGDTDPTAITAYTTHVNSSDITEDAIGDSPLYGFRFTDHRGRGYGVRYVYRKFGESFSDENTTLPSTLEDEVIIHINDDDVSMGGFSIGGHMLGWGDPTGRLDASGLQLSKWRGNRWRGMYAPDAGVDAQVTWDGTANTLTVVFQAPFNTGASSSPLANHTDLLGYLGYPHSNGVIHLHDTFTGTSQDGFIGNVLSYESRTVDDITGTHIFYGVRGESFSSSHYVNSGTVTNTARTQPHASNNTMRVLLSSRINWTTLVTDEVLAYATNVAINHPNPNQEDGIAVDVRRLYACDGRTLGEWGVAEDAIIVRSHNPQRGATPISRMFSSKLHTDYTIQAAHLEYGEYETLAKDATGIYAFSSSSDAVHQPISDALLDKNRQIDAGYLPRTVLQIRTKGRGYHANTPTPILVDSFNDPVPVDTWRKNLKGITFTSTSGDHILPALNNDMILIDGYNSTTKVFNTPSSSYSITHALIPAGQESHTIDSFAKELSFGERKRFYYTDKQFALLASEQGSNSLTKIELERNDFANDDWVANFTGTLASKDHIFMRFGQQQIGGRRSYGAVDAEPLVYFKGAKDSNDHSVPLYFGGGFSGVVLDINDGTENDYSSFYTHPYSNGPTGTAGIQNANEISTSFAIVDCNALLAFFPATPLLNQHRGSLSHPVANRNNILSPDLANGAQPPHPSRPAHVQARYAAGIVEQKPSPLILRVANPNARYKDTDVGETHTTYIIFGPGQAFPFTEMTAVNTDEQPHPGYVITTGNTWSKVPASKNLPNEIKNSDNQYGPPSAAYQTARQVFHWNTTWNWSPAQGIPNIGTTSAGLLQRPEHGYHYGEHFTGTHYPTASNFEDYRKAHPYKFVGAMYYGIAMGADLCFHMDGGYHPGGSWMDNQLSFNPPHDISDYKINRGHNIVHPSAFRVSGKLANNFVTGASNENIASLYEDEFIVVDATRCQNGEELATILGQSINEFPGSSAIKAMGGTFAPSMGNAMRQDRYGWIEMSFGSYTVDGTAPSINSSKTILKATIGGATQATLEQIPACGWLRTPDGGTTTVGSGDIPTFAPYHSREVVSDGSGGFDVHFLLAPNRVHSLPLMESLTTYQNKIQHGTVTHPNYSGGNPSAVYVWSKAGVHRFNNENDSARHHMTQVHFNGVVDAIDRTRPIGAVGWAGERYSYLNSLKVGSEQYGAGLGAWHPMLGFSPYGASNSCMTAFGHLAHSNPIYHSPEASPRISNQSSADTVITTPYTWKYSLAHSNSYYTGAGFEGAKNYTLGNKPVTYRDNSDDTFALPRSLHMPQGVYSRAFVVISYESEMALVAKHDRDGIKATGDWLSVSSKVNVDSVAPATAITFAGTTRWDERIHNPERFTAPANAGPNVEALVRKNGSDPFTMPTAEYPSAFNFGAPLASDEDLYNAEPCFNETGDLFYDIDISPGAYHLESSAGVERNLQLKYIDSGIGDVAITSRYNVSAERRFWKGDLNAFQLAEDSPVKNFSVENVVWKRMDGGNLSLPAVNARGLGAVPFITRVLGGTAYTTGEKLFGNCRFSFETTNGAMFPIIQAQELSHPQIAVRHPDELRNVLEIPNEELQFLAMSVVDDTGQEHSIEGGSPFGTIIRSFKQISDRTAEGLAPSEAGSGVEPNLKIQLPDADAIPGNIIVRSGFDRLQAYQNETMGTGGMLRPNIETGIEGIFTDATDGPRLGPTFSDHEYDHISQNSVGEAFPDMTRKGWKSATNNAPLKTSYELHDRALFFHITKNGNSHTHRYPTFYTHANGITNNALTASSFSGTTLTVNTTINTTLYRDAYGDSQKDGGGTRRFLRIYNDTTGESGVASFTGISTNTFTGCVGDSAFDAIVAKSSITSFSVVPSYYVPAGSNRFFAARRIRDHAEVSGNSPDMAHSMYVAGHGGPNVLCYDAYKKTRLTPMAIPRMGHHFVNATQVMLPGHWAHPAYQGLYSKHRADRSATQKNLEQDLIQNTALSVDRDNLPSTTLNQLPVYDPMIAFGAMTATPSGPSDIHGGGFTLMFETKVKYDGYGMLASKGQAGVVNSKGGHTIVLEAGATYTLKHHFPDPSEVGAYQIIIQPNVHKSQFYGYHENGGATGLPDGSVNELTGQQVALVIGIREPDSATGGLGLVLAEATMADVRGCEVFINEVMLDHDPDYGGQLANIPPLLLYNALGVQGTEAPAFTRRSLPYHPGMFVDATPGFTTNIPWWSIVHKVSPEDSSAVGFRHLTWHRIDNYYEFLRAGAGSIACQLTLAGYPSNYPDFYSTILENVSLSPVAVVKSVASTLITVDDARGFPKVPYYGMKLEYTDANGIRRTHSYTERSGNDATYMNKPYRFTISASSNFTSNLTVGTKIRLTRAYDFRPAGILMKESRSSIFTRMLPQLLQGSRDTNSLHMADAYLCLWNPNLGRPHTFYSDASRTWLSTTADRAVNRKPLNSMPEHYETIHYHDATYYNSLGPFTFAIKTSRPIEPLVTNAGSSRVIVSTSTNVITTAASPPQTPNNRIQIENEIFIVVSDNGTALTVNRDITHLTNGSKIYIHGDGEAVTSTGLHSDYTAQGGTGVMLNHYWPCGSRGGPLTSRLDGYGYVSTAWDYPQEYTSDGPVWVDHDDDGSYTVALGLTKSVYDSFTDATCDYNNDPTITMDSTAKLAIGMGVSGTGIPSGATVASITNATTFELSASTTGGSKTNQTLTFTPVNTRPRPFGYRFGLRQPYNKPQWAMYGARAYRETAITASNTIAGYQHGPLVQLEQRTTGSKWEYVGGSGLSNANFNATYVGIMERQTNFSAMLGVDKPEWQVRYSNGMRMTRAFGCPVRVLRNASTVIRDWWGDPLGKNISKVDEAVKYYLVDWWGNTRGEDVRRYPVRGFGIRPAWDCSDVYEYDRTNNLTPYARLWNGGNPLVNLKTLVDFTNSNLTATTVNFPRMAGRINNVNNNDSANPVDVFFPTNPHRVGDMGNGRGVRYPTMFNEDVLTDLDEPYHATGVVLSHHTAEPNTSDGYVRPRNDILQANEVLRGISARLGIDEDGLLKPEAVASDRVEDFTGDTPHKDAISRSSPRIGIDSENIEGVDDNLIAINTEAHSLHTDRNVGQRVVMEGGLTAGSQTLADYDLTSLTFAGQPQGGAMRLTHTSNFNPMGGTYLAETRNFLAPISDKDWGGFVDATCDTNHSSGLSDGSSTSVRHITMDSTAKLVVGMTVTGTGIPSSATVAAINNGTCFTLSADTTATNNNTTLTFGPPTGQSSNPYATSTFVSANAQTNLADKKITFMLRPVRLLDKQHVEMFRPNNNLHSSSPQYGANYFSATGGGKYGIYMYEAENARASSGLYLRNTNPDTNPPYVPAYTMKISASETVPMSKGPKLPGIGETSFDSTKLNNAVTRIVISENTLQHYRADAARRRSRIDSDETTKRMDFSVVPRFSQALHPKGHKGDVTYNTSDHTGDGA